MREPRDFIGPTGEVTTDILLNGDDVPIKLPSKEPFYAHRSVTCPLQEEKLLFAEGSGDCRDPHWLKC